MAVTAIEIPKCQDSYEHLFSKEAVSSVLLKAMVKRNEVPPDRYNLIHFMRRQDMNNGNCLLGYVEHKPHEV